jgi:putative endonuclease
LVRRAYEPREGLVAGFSKQHKIKLLAYYERYDAVLDAIQREKNIKHWPRQWKINLICSMNPEWRDLFDDIAR